MNHNLCTVCKIISSRSLHRCDIEKLCIWRNDGDLCKFLNLIPTITEMVKENKLGYAFPMRRETA